MNTHAPIRSIIWLGLAILCLSLTANAQSTLPCETCHPSEKADWLLGRHSNTQTDVAGELAANWVGQAPDSVIHGSAAEDCVACHGPVAVSTGTGMTEVQVMGHFFTTTGGVYTASTTVADTLNWPHVACVTCHNVPSDHPATMPALSIFNSASAKYDSLPTSPRLCGQCHGTLRFADTDHRIYEAWKLSRHGHRGQEDLAGELAGSWAGQTADSVINGSAAENCIACHAPSSVPQKGTITEVDVLNRFFTTTGGAFTASTVATDTVHWPDMACNACHNPHNPAALSYYNSTTKTYQVMGSSNELCGQCHGSLRFPETDHRSYDLELGTGGVGVADKITMPGAQCVDCHMGKSDVDGTNSLMFKGHRWAPVFKEPDASSFASCTQCHAGMSADSATAQIVKWQAEFQSLDSTTEALYVKADSVAQARQDPTKLQLVADARHNLDMVEMDESGGFHNHLYTVALLNDAAAREGLVTGIQPPAKGKGLPVVFSLLQNYPNPFNPTTVVSYQLPVASDVRLVVYDLLGRELIVLVNERKAPGSYDVRFDASGMASGVYLYRLTAGSFVQTRKLLLLK